MIVRVNKNGDVALRDQVAAQLEFLIATRKLKPGDALPSVRALARQLGIHHNTVSEAYQDLVQKQLLVGRRGSRMMVRVPEEPLIAPPRKDLDDLINETVRLAKRHGYTMQQLSQRVRERMAEEPPDHVLALSSDAGMRQLFQAELRRAFSYPIRVCSPEELAANPSLASGALVISAPGIMPAVTKALSKSQPAIPIVYSSAEQHLEIVRQLPDSSVVAVVSVSQEFMAVARGVLSPEVGRSHSLVERLLIDNTYQPGHIADIVFCDAIALQFLHPPSKDTRLIPYFLIAPACLEQIRLAMSVHTTRATRSTARRKRSSNQRRSVR